LKPTLLIGDHILVGKNIYHKNEPQSGDLIVFPYPKNPSKHWIKRSIGVEGDKIEIKDDILYLNNKRVELKFIEKYSDQIILKADRYLEILGEKSDQILDVYNRGENFGPVVVPRNSFFVLGDNRDNSFDSRHFGFIERSTVKGKALKIYWSWDSKDFHIRWNRIGKIIL